MYEREYLCRRRLIAVNEDKRCSIICQGESPEFIYAEFLSTVVTNDPAAQYKYASVLGILDETNQIFLPIWTLFQEVVVDPQRAPKVLRHSSNIIVY